MGKAKRHSGAALAAAGMLLTAVLAGQLPGREVWQELGQRAMMVSAVCSMPSQGLELLERRFAGEEESEQPKEPEPAADPAKTQEEAPAAEEAAEDPVEDQEELPQGQQEPGEAQTAEEEASQPEEIPEEYQGPVVEEDFSGSGISCGAGLVKNSTELSDEEVRELIAAENQVTLSAQGPQVLIMHTHATESFERWDRPVYDTRSTWRTTDNSQNMMAVGEVIAQELQKHGIQVLHDTTQHDYPSYNGSYERSAETVQRYLEEYPSISVVLDVHRDAIQREETLVKPVFEVDGQKAAQVMIIAGCDDGTMGMPNWPVNFRFAVGMQNAMESAYPGLTRPIFFCYRKYNQQLTTGSLLIEVGSHGNTLEEELRTAHMVGDALGGYFSTLVEKE